MRSILAEDRTWAGIHAAEALLAAGQREEVRRALLEDLQQPAPTFPRIGAWRTLIQTATTSEEREGWQHRIEAVFLDLSAPDHKQALESLAKLRRPLHESARQLAARLGGEQPAASAVLAWWVLANEGEATALARVGDALSDDNPLARQRAGYVLRWIRPDDRVALKVLDAAAAAEPLGGLPRLFLVSAAFSLQVNPAASAARKRELLAALHDGPAAASYEAGLTLATHLDAEELDALRPLLSHSEPDIRIAAAHLLLAARKSPSSP